MMNIKHLLWKYGLLLECACIAFLVFMFVWEF